MFLAHEPALEDYWRAVILFGRNVASYKFALAQALLDLKPASGQLVKLDELAGPFAEHIAEHLKTADKQGTFASSKFLDACRGFNDGSLSRVQLIDETVRIGFNNVIDAFHVVGRGEIPRRFYVDERRDNGGIRITDEFSRLIESAQAENLPTEVQARWRLVETAWELGVSRSLVRVDHDPGSESLFALDRSLRRQPITSSRGALNGYQKGKCFYCFADISLTRSDLLPEVDHFFPHVLKSQGFGPLVDGIWNLVLACRDCNRGVGGKFDRVPTLNLLERLWRRNEFLIASHHPLRETLLQQTGMAESERRRFLNDWHGRAWAALIHSWEPEPVARAPF